MIKRTIFILGTITFILFLTGRVSFAQNFSTIIDPSFYPSTGSGSSIPLNPSIGQAVLIYRSEPSYSVSAERVITDVNIVPSVVITHDFHLSSQGYYTNIGDSYSLNYFVIDAEHIYSRSGIFRPALLESINTILSSKGLGTVSQRRLLIQSFGGSIVSPYDFRDFLKPWIAIALSISIAIPAWYLFRRFLRG